MALVSIFLIVPNYYFDFTCLYHLNSLSFGSFTYLFLFLSLATGFVQSTYTLVDQYQGNIFGAEECGTTGSCATIIFFMGPW